MTKLVYLANYSPSGNAIDDDSAKINTALAACGNNGTLVLEGEKKYFLGPQSLTIPKGVKILNPGLAGGNNGYDQAWADQLGGFVTDPSYPIVMQSRTVMENVTIHPKGMTFPQTDASTWSGSCITTNTGLNEVDIELKNTLVMGYYKALDGYNCPRIHLDKFMMDCVNGLTISNAGDCIRLENCHAWPFASVSGPNGNAGLPRYGTAYEFIGNTDGGTVTNCFSTSYLTGVRVADLNGLRFNGHGAESPYISNSTGFLIQGNADNIELNACQAVGLQNGVVADLSSKDNLVNINGGLFFSNSDSHIRSFNGTITARNAMLRYAKKSHFALIGNNSRIIAQNNIYEARTGLNAVYNGAIASQFISHGNIRF